MGQIARQKLPEGSFANKADAGGIFLGRIGQANPTGNRPHDGLWQVAYREQGSSELSLIEPMKEITLIFSPIEAPQEFTGFRVLSLPHPGVMARCNPLGAKHQGMIEKCTKLNFSVTQDVRIGGPTGFVFPQKLGEHSILVLSGEINGFEGHAGAVRGTRGVN
jgi:hypothetical protein